MKAVQIGGGLVGQVIAADMMKEFEVTVVTRRRRPRGSGEEMPRG